MCGLYAIFAYGQAAAPVLGDELTNVREAMHPRGLKCTWDVRKPIRKHYRFD